MHMHALNFPFGIQGLREGVWIVLFSDRERKTGESLIFFPIS